MKLTKVVVASVALSMLMSSTAMAGTWKKGAGENQSRWWYDNENGTYAHSGWQWLDGNKDGVAECYYFDSEGWLVTGTTTPDGYQVDANGAWTVNGAVQTKNTAAANASLDGCYNYYMTAIYVKNEQTNSYDLYKETKRFEEVIDSSVYDEMWNERFSIGQAADTDLVICVEDLGDGKMMHYGDLDGTKLYAMFTDGEWANISYEWDGGYYTVESTGYDYKMQCDGTTYEVIKTYTMNGDYLQPGDFYYPLIGKDLMVKEIYKKK